MPDPHKHQALAAAGFRLVDTCASCVHWIATGWGRWGRCGRALHGHAKHTGTRLAGTPSVGTCDLHQRSAASASRYVGDDYAARYYPDDAPAEDATR